MRHTAGLLDADHPETIAGDHVRDAAKVLEHGSTEGAKRHLDAAMGLLTPQNLVRHGIKDDEGHATAKHHMHQIHRHHLIVQDIEDTRARNEQMREALRASREQIKATTQQAVAGPPQPGHMPPGYQQPSKAVTALAVELSLGERFYRYKHGWIPIGDTKAAALHGQVIHGQDRHFRTVHGKYDHATRTIDDPTRGKVPVRQVSKTVPAKAKRGVLHRMLPQPAAGLSNEIELRNVSKELRDYRGRWRVSGSVPTVGTSASPLGRKVSHEEMMGGLGWMAAQHGTMTMEGHRPPGFVGRQGSVYGKKLSRKEAMGAMSALAPAPLTSYKGGLLPGQLVQRQQLTKSQRVIYDKLRARGRAHAGAFLIASKFQPGMLESAVLANHGLAVELVGPKGWSHGWKRPVSPEITVAGVPREWQPLVQKIRRIRQQRRKQQARRKLTPAPALTNRELGALLLASSHGRHIPGTPYTYKHGWAKLDSQTEAGRFGAGLLAGSFEHIRAIEDLAERAGAGSDDPGRRSPTMRTALNNVAKAVGGRDMRRARVHLDAARWANQREAGGYYSRDLRDLRRQLELVPPGVTGWEGKIRNPLSPAGQHPGRFRPTSSIRPPAHPTAGVRQVSYQAYSNATELAGPYRYKHGWIRLLDSMGRATQAVERGPGQPLEPNEHIAGWPAARHLDGKHAVGKTGFGKVVARGIYRHRDRTVNGLRVHTVRASRARRIGRGVGKALNAGSATRAASQFSVAAELSARTAQLERTPAPRGRPGGPGLYHVKGLGHTPYLQQVVKALIEERGMPPGKAYAIARARIRKWSATSRHPEVRAASTRAEAGEIARQGRGHAHTADRARDIELSLAWLHERRNRRGEWDQGGGGKYDPVKTHRMEAAAGIEPGAGLILEMQGKDSRELEHESWNITDPQRRKAAQRELQARLGSGQYTLPKGRLGPNLPQNPYLTAKYGNDPSFSADAWEVADTLIELACEPIDLFNPYHAPTGQFTTAQGTGQGTPKQKRQKLLKRAASLRSQIRGLETQLHAATAHRKSRSSRPAKRGAAATSAKQASQAKQTAAKAGKTTARAKTQTMSPATIRAKIAVLRGQLQATLAQLKRL